MPKWLSSNRTAECWGKSQLTSSALRRAANATLDNGYESASKTNLPAPNFLWSTMGSFWALSMTSQSALVGSIYRWPAQLNSFGNRFDWSLLVRYCLEWNMRIPQSSDFPTSTRGDLFSC